jgi:hypothetical protein
LYYIQFHLGCNFLNGYTDLQVHLVSSLLNWGGWDFKLMSSLYSSYIFNVLVGQQYVVNPKWYVVIVGPSFQILEHPILFLKSVYLWSRSANLSKANISLVLVPIISSQTLRFFGGKAFLCLFSFLISSGFFETFRNRFKTLQVLNLGKKTE